MGMGMVEMRCKGIAGEFFAYVFEVPTYIYIIIMMTTKKPSDDGWGKADYYYYYLVSFSFSSPWLRV